MDYKKKYLKYKLKYLNIIKGGTTEWDEKMNKYSNSIGRENISYGCWWGWGCDEEDRKMASYLVMSHGSKCRMTPVLEIE